MEIVRKNQTKSNSFRSNRHVDVNKKRGNGMYFKSFICCFLRLFVVSFVVSSLREIYRPFIINMWMVVSQKSIEQNIFILPPLRDEVIYRLLWLKSVPLGNFNLRTHVFWVKYDEQALFVCLAGAPLRQKFKSLHK